MLRVPAELLASYMFVWDHGYAREAMGHYGPCAGRERGSPWTMSGSIVDESFVLLEATRAAWGESRPSGLHA